MGWYKHPKLNIMWKPIAKKYREGKLKTLIYDEILKVHEFKPIL